MTGSEFLALVVLFALLALSVPRLGRYLARVYADDGLPAPGDRVFLPAERCIYRVAGIDPSGEQRWSAYLRSLLAFGAVSCLVLYAILRLQGMLPLNPVGLGPVDPDLAFNTSVSFVTNTNWQAYAGESTLTHLSQMAGLTVQNFVSAAVGMSVVVALIRGLARQRCTTIGNFWVDLTRSIVRVLLPLSFVFALVLVSQGVIQNLGGFTEVTTLQGQEQLVPGGPAASQVAIKQLGSNGGGFFNVNSAHPFENPTSLTNLFENLAILALPLALAVAFGHMVRDRRQGRVLIAVMIGLWATSLVIASFAETGGNPLLSEVGVDQSVSATQAGGNMEGKEVRFGPVASATWSASTTGTSNGSVNAMQDSFTPLGGGVAMLNMMLGEISPGGVGVGLMGMLVFALLTVFLAGLMVGRTPEYLGKKIQATEIRLVVLYLVAAPVVLLGFAAASVALSSPQASIQAPGPHGLSEVLYAYASAAGNNGSAFAGLAADTTWFNSTIGIAILVGRFFLIIPALAIAGSLGAKRSVPVTAGTFPTHTGLFAGLLTGVVLIVAGLTFFPALALGPIVEQLSL